MAQRPVNDCEVLAIKQSLANAELLLQSEHKLLFAALCFQLLTAVGSRSPAVMKNKIHLMLFISAEGLYLSDNTSAL